MADKIVLNNGPEIEGATIVQAIWTANHIQVSVPNNDLVQMAILFGNPENTKKIEYYYSILKDVYIGYTTVTDIGLNMNGTGINILLKGDESAHMDREYTIPSNFIPEVIANSINENEKETNQNGPESNDSAGSD